MRHQLWIMSEGSRVLISLRGFSASACYVFYSGSVAGLINTYVIIWCCSMISLQPWIKVIKYSLLRLTWHIRVGDKYLLSIHSWEVHEKCYILHYLFLGGGVVVLTLFRMDGGGGGGGANLSLGNFLIYIFAFDFRISTLQVFF